MQLTWTREENCVNERRVGPGFRETVAYIGSPAESMHETGAAVRHRLDRLDPKLDHSYLFHLAARGGTHYFALPIAFSTGEKNLVCIATDRAGGFSELDLAKFRVLAELIALPLENFVAHCTALALLETYVGPRAGWARLAGADPSRRWQNHRRGDLVQRPSRFHAAVGVSSWGECSKCSTRTSSSLTRRLPREAEIHFILNPAVDR